MPSCLGRRPEHTLVELYAPFFMQEPSTVGKSNLRKDKFFTVTPTTLASRSDQTEQGARALFDSVELS